MRVSIAVAHGSLLTVHKCLHGCGSYGFQQTIGGRPLEVYDFTQMYTQFVQHDMKQQLAACVDAVLIPGRQINLHSGW